MVAPEQAPFAAVLAAELGARLPRLLFAAVDLFPLAGGEAGGGVSVLAVRAEPVHQRLDAGTAAQLRCLVLNGQPVQSEERLLRLCVTGAGWTSGDEVPVRVCWHDVADFASQLLKGNPSCVEALASEDPPLYAAPEWSALREAFGRSSCNALLSGKTYRNACSGAVMRLARLSSKTKKQGERQAEIESVEEGVAADRLGTPAAVAAAALLRRAVGGGLCEALSARLAELVENSEDHKGEWSALASDIMLAAKGLPHATAELPARAVHAWVDGVRREDFRAFASQCGAEAAPTPPPDRRSLDALGPAWAGRLDAAWPQGAELAFMAQTGSFMYDLQVPSSDSDFSFVFLASPEDLASCTPPPTEFHRHSEASFASAKTGEVEYSGKELGSFLLELAKGNPRNIEFLFTEKPHFSSPVWQELRARRQGFITLRCARQYLGFIADRLSRASRELEACTPAGEALDEASARRVSKWLYHGYHKLFELARILEAGRPSVALAGNERNFVLEIRLQPPGTRKQAEMCLAEAEGRLRELSTRLDSAGAVAALPEEVDAEALIAWLRSIRARQAAAATQVSDAHAA